MSSSSSSSTTRCWQSSPQKNQEGGVDNDDGGGRSTTPSTAAAKAEASDDTDNNNDDDDVVMDANNNAINGSNSNSNSNKAKLVLDLESKLMELEKEIGQMDVNFDKSSKVFFEDKRSPFYFATVGDIGSGVNVKNDEEQRRRDDEALLPKKEKLEQQTTDDEEERNEIMALNEMARSSQKHLESLERQRSTKEMEYSRAMELARIEEERKQMELMEQVASYTKTYTHMKLDTDRERLTLVQQYRVEQTSLRKIRDEVMEELDVEKNKFKELSTDLESMKDILRMKEEELQRRSSGAEGEIAQTQTDLHTSKIQFIQDYELRCIDHYKQMEGMTSDIETQRKTAYETQSLTSRYIRDRVDIDARLKMVKNRYAREYEAHTFKVTSLTQESERLRYQIRQLELYQGQYDKLVALCRKYGLQWIRDGQPWP